ncbi:hypothetical protein KFL_000860010, partial [Klebsormidium nitens]
MLAILLSGSTALAFFLRNATCGTALTQLVQSYQNNLIERTSDDVLNLFNSGDLCARVLVGTVQRIYVAPLNASAGVTLDTLIDRAIFATFTDCAQTSTLAFSKEDGTFSGISSPDNVTIGNNAAVRVLKGFSNQTTPKGQVPPRYTMLSNSLDPRTRDWYTQAMSSPDGLAAQLLVGANGQPQLVLSRRVVLSKTGEVLGVVTLSFYLTAISRFMSKFDLKGGLMYVTNGTMLVADTVNDYPAAFNASTRSNIVPARKSNNSLVRDSFSYLQAVGQVNASGASTYREVRLSGALYYLHYRDLQFRNVVIRQVMHLPRGSIMGPIDSGARYTKAIVIGVTAAICALGCLLIVLFTDPVSKEMRLKAQVIENLEGRRQAEAREECKTNFLARTSHDLRTPSAAMLGLLDMILESSLDTEQAERVKQVKECALSQLNLLNDILDFSKIEAGKMELENEVFDIGNMLESLMDMFSVQCNAKGLEVWLDMD